MSEFDYELPDEEEFVADVPASPQDRLNAAFAADPAGMINAVAQQAASERAHEVAAVMQQHASAQIAQYGYGVQMQAAETADRRMKETYGEEWVERRGDVAAYVTNRPYLHNVDFANPEVTLDVLNNAFLAIRHEAQNRDDQSEWQRIRQAGRPLDGY